MVATKHRTHVNSTKEKKTIAEKGRKYLTAMLPNPLILCRYLHPTNEQQVVREVEHNDIPQDTSRQSSTQRSPEQQAFREMYCTLQGAIINSSDLDTFASKLYQQKFITQSKRIDVQSQHQSPQKRCTALLDAVENQIKHDSRRFHSFIDLLSEEPAMETVATMMHNKWAKVSFGVRSPNKIPESPSCIHYTEPLTGEHFDNTCNQYRKAIMSSNSLEVDSLTENIMNTEGETDFKAFFLCYQGLEKATVPYQLDKAERILKHSLKLAEASHNRELLLGRAYRILAGVPRRKRDYKRGLEIVEKGKEALQHAEPSSETACLFMEEALLRQLSDKWAPERQEKIKKLLKLALKHAKLCKDHQRARYTVSLVYLRQALFYLDAFEDKKSTSALPENLCRAEECLRLVELNVVGGANVYVMEYYVACSCLSLYRQNPTEALRCARKAEGLLRESRIADDSYLHVRERLEILKERHAITKGRETQV